MKATAPVYNLNASSCVTMREHKRKRHRDGKHDEAGQERNVERRRAAQAREHEKAKAPQDRKRARKAQGETEQTEEAGPVLQTLSRKIKFKVRERGAAQRRARGNDLQMARRGHWRHTPLGKCTYALL